jgi:hypothetical protein
MSKTYIAQALRQRVAEQGQYRCGYCLTQERVVGVAMDIEHIIPEALGGPTEEQNLWLACSLCNSHKGDKLTARDPHTNEVVQLFNPRQDAWERHFRWADGGALIEGYSATGRATVIALQLNRPALVRARRLWINVGWHPPIDVL